MCKLSIKRLGKDIIVYEFAVEKGKRDKKTVNFYTKNIQKKCINKKCAYC